MTEKEMLTLISDWAFYADAKAPEKQVALFAENFENVTILPDGERQSFNEAQTLLAGIKTALSAYQKTFHFNGQTKCDLEKRHATSYCIAHHFRADGTVLVMYIRYEDDFIREKGVVKFSRRELHIEQMEER